MLPRLLTASWRYKDILFETIFPLCASFPFRGAFRILAFTQMWELRNPSLVLISSLQSTFQRFFMSVQLVVHVQHDIMYDDEDEEERRKGSKDIWWVHKKGKILLILLLPPNKIFSRPKITHFLIHFALHCSQREAAGTVLNHSTWIILFSRLAQTATVVMAKRKSLKINILISIQAQVVGRFNFSRKMFALFSSSP